MDMPCSKSLLLFSLCLARGSKGKRKKGQSKIRIWLRPVLFSFLIPVPVMAGTLALGPLVAYLTLGRPPARLSWAPFVPCFSQLSRWDYNERLIHADT